jgi:hypothetical protein
MARRRMDLCCLPVRACRGHSRRTIINPKCLALNGALELPHLRRSAAHPSEACHYKVTVPGPSGVALNSMTISSPPIILYTAAPGTIILFGTKGTGNGIKLSLTGTSPSGSSGEFAGRRLVTFNSGTETGGYSVVGPSGLDSCSLYPGSPGSGALTLYDGPNFTLKPPPRPLFTPGPEVFQQTQGFSMYYVYRPGPSGATSDNMFVTLGKVVWSWGASATWTGFDNSVWILTTTNAPPNVSGTLTNELPLWSAVATGVPAPVCPTP